MNNIIFFSIVMILTIGYFAIKIKSLKRFKHLREAAICRKFPEAVKGYRLIEGKGNMEYIYLNDKMYSIVFSNAPPYEIVFVEELQRSAIDYVERECISRRVR